MAESVEAKRARHRLKIRERMVIIELPDDPKLLRELRALGRRRGSSGRDRVDHPPGMHDDRANAVAGVVSLLRAAAEPELVAPIAVLRDGVADPSQPWLGVGYNEPTSASYFPAGWKR